MALSIVTYGLLWRVSQEKRIKQNLSVRYNILEMRAAQIRNVSIRRALEIIWLNSIIEQSRCNWMNYLTIDCRSKCSFINPKAKNLMEDQERYVGTDLTERIRAVIPNP